MDIRCLLFDGARKDALDEVPLEEEVDHDDGAMMIIVPAHRSGMLLPYACTNFPRPDGAVRLAGSWMRISASRNWFQAHMKYRRPSVVSAGRAVGSRTLVRIRRCRAVHLGGLDEFRGTDSKWLASRTRRTA